MKPSGSIFYQDAYETIYHLDWETVNGDLDVTSTIFQPYVWGESPQGYIKNGILFRRGILTITRQLIRPLAGGYEIIADGTSQYITDEQMNFPCQVGPQDKFKYHLNNGMVDECGGLVIDGVRWADPDNPDDIVAVWGDIDSSGNPITTGSGIFVFDDVWS